DLLGPAAGPAARLGFGILTGDSGNLDATLQAWEPDQARRQALREAAQGGDIVIGPGRYYVNGIRVENEAAGLYSKQAGYPFEAATTLEALQKHEGGLLFYLDVWEQFVTALEQPGIRDVALNGVETCGRAKVMWAVRALLPKANQALDCSAAQGLPSLGTGR